MMMGHCSHNAGEVSFSCKKLPLVKSFCLLLGLNSRCIKKKVKKLKG